MAGTRSGPDEMANRRNWDKAKHDSFMAGATCVYGEEIVSKADMIPGKFTVAGLRKAMARAIQISSNRWARLDRKAERRAARKALKAKPNSN